MIYVMCRCNANYYGRNCSQGQGVCEIVQPCLNGGVCSDTLTGATCTCPQSESLSFLIGQLYYY
jgi:hypothetical protein